MTPLLFIRRLGSSPSSDRFPTKQQFQYNSFTRQSIKATKKTHRNLVQGTLSRQLIQYCTCCSSFNILEHQCFWGILLSSQFMDNGSNNKLYCKIRFPWRTFCGSTKQQNPKIMKIVCKKYFWNASTITLQAPDD